MQAEARREAPFCKKIKNTESSAGSILQPCAFAGPISIALGPPFKLCREGHLQPLGAAEDDAENGAGHLALAAQVTQPPGEAELDQIEDAQPVAVRELGENETEYGGRIITEEDGEFSFSRLSFSSLETAHSYIDELGGGTRKS